MNSLLFWRKNPQKPSHNYHPVVSALESSYSDENKVEIRVVPGAQHATWRRNLFGVVILLVSVLIALGIYTAKLYPLANRSLGPQPITCLCGSSTAEAEALGCKYDSLAACWLPDHCRDDELTAEFENAGSGPNGEWPYWADRNATRQLSIKEVGLLADLSKHEAVFYSTFGWHVAHCAFYWRKEFRMRAKGLMLENRYDREDHVAHCYPIFMASIPVDSIGAAFGVNIGGERVVGGHMHEP